MPLIPDKIDFIWKTPHWQYTCKISTKRCTCDATETFAYAKAPVSKTLRTGIDIALWRALEVLLVVNRLLNHFKENLLILVLFSSLCNAGENTLKQKNQKCSELPQNWHLLATGTHSLKKKWPAVLSFVEKKTGNVLKKPKIAVVDAGPLDYQKYINGEITIQKASAASLDPFDPAQLDHGLRVLSVISGKQAGMLSDVDLRFYNNSIRNSENQISIDGNAGFDAAVLACDDGYTVINMSSGAQFDAFEKLDDLTRKKIKLLEDGGCLLVKAAGNGNAMSRRLDSGLYGHNSMVTVGSSNRYGLLSTFSSLGEINLPGEDLILPAHTIVTQNACSSNSEPINGTSFSAPGVTAVAGMLRTILDSSTEYNSKPKKERLRVLRDILNAATVGTLKQLNPVRAVFVALSSLDKMHEQIENIISKSVNDLSSIQSVFCPRSIKVNNVGEMSFYLLGCNHGSEDIQYFRRITQNGNDIYLQVIGALDLKKGQISGSLLQQELARIENKQLDPNRKLSLIKSLLNQLPFSSIDKAAINLLHTMYPKWDRSLAKDFVPLESEAAEKLIYQAVLSGIIRPQIMNDISDRKVVDNKTSVQAFDLIQAMVKMENLSNDHIEAILEMVEERRKWNPSDDRLFAASLFVAAEPLGFDAFAYLKRLIPLVPIKFDLETVERRIQDSRTTGRITLENELELRKQLRHIF